MGSCVERMGFSRLRRSSSPSLPSAEGEGGTSENAQLAMGPGLAVVTAELVESSSTQPLSAHHRPAPEPDKSGEGVKLSAENADAEVAPLAVPLTVTAVVAPTDLTSLHAQSGLEEVRAPEGAAALQPCAIATPVFPVDLDPLTGDVQGASGSPGGMFTYIMNKSVALLNTTTNVLDLSSVASSCHIRLLDCEALFEEDVIRIAEFIQFPSVPYAAVSYPWRGVPISMGWSGRTFAVEGAKEADPVGVDALRHACSAALARGCHFLWLDRLCIMQTSPEDKKWQIRHMYHVYKSSRVCLVLAGGLQRLVRLDEDTPWIHRSWTLQEVLAPPFSLVLFQWKLGSGRTHDGSGGVIEEVVRSESAMSTVALILQASTAGTMSFTSDSGEKSLLVEISIFSAVPSKHDYNDIPFWRPQRKILAANVSALSMAMDPALMSDTDMRAHAVWQSALMRTSSRPVDMVLSIMGLFNVTLDPSAFHENDRRGATIALAQEILRAGGSASWLGVGYRIEPDRYLSSFPTLPRTSVAGTALIHTGSTVQEVSELVDPVYPVSETLVPLPRATMSSDGYLTFSAKAIPLRTAPHEPDPHATFFALDESIWIPEPTSAPDAHPQAYAVLLGWFNRYYPGMTSAHDTQNIRIMLLEEHGQGLFHLRSFFSLHQRERKQVLTWAEREFCVGGPLPLPAVETTLAAPSLAAMQSVSQTEPPWPRIPTSRPVVTVEDTLIRRARWAVPQQSLEQSYSLRQDADSELNK